MCTKMDLECQKTGEYTVNECTSSKSIFGFWIINIAKQCPGKELVTCQDNTQISSRIEIDRDKCKYSLTFI
ncbi:hypothetical protein HYV88_06440 [Candidatus Woesearchaeota archaeon]|nr:hypothetical protein [Candidatus Woesearchaeota archaeon]